MDGDKLRPYGRKNLARCLVASRLCLVFRAGEKGQAGMPVLLGPARDLRLLLRGFAGFVAEDYLAVHDLYAGHVGGQAELFAILRGGH